MKQFLDDRFLLTNSTAETLYQNYAKTMPIFDFHCHLNPAEIAGNKKYRNITEIWLGGDHYKWRAMRACGVNKPRVNPRSSVVDYEDALTRLGPRDIMSITRELIREKLARRKRHGVAR